uniref:PDZ domain-containing protein n=1 Tax=Alexandrium andersonii TaxID=327968 RepID=A0A7S2FVR1_9DINO|mmetsp:Transcript_34272/g.77897  ORF Transcript_34272/g.77897 Transcript_34272/m.77897 type:complete len:166 (+) Transcript_34272:121-618(+)
MGAVGCRCDGDAAVDKTSEQTHQQDSRAVEPQSVLKESDAAALATSESYRQEAPPAGTVIVEEKKLEEKKAEKSIEKGLSMLFKSDADKEATLNVTFTRTPLGMSFNSGELPIVVKEVLDDGEARGLGIKEGMIITAIAGVNVSGMSYDAAFALMKKHAAELPRK